MPLSFPFTEYTSAGAPVTFYVGASSTRFDVHHFVLSKISPLFVTSRGLPLIVSKPLELPDIDPKIFRMLFQWLYERKPPVFNTPEDLLQLMKLWVTAGKLGIWRSQNTVLRLGMELMQPRDVVCGIETVRWVYDNTPPHSRLRNYIIAIFCQRCPPITAAMFSSANERLGVFRNASSFLRTLHKVRSGNPKGVDGYDLATRFHTEHTLAEGQEFGCLVTRGEEVDWSRVEYRLPTFLVWGGKWQTLPDT